MWGRELESKFYSIGSQLGGGQTGFDLVRLEGWSERERSGSEGWACWTYQLTEIS